MAAAQADLADGPDSPGKDLAPLPFRQVLAALDGARPRPEIQLERLPAPKRLAPFAHALEAAVLVDGEELADGRFILLHNPAGPESWQGTFRVVTLARAELEPEMAADPLLPEVTWSWLTGALGARSVAYRLPSGTVTQAGSHYFGGLVERPSESQIEIRASWTPLLASLDGAEATDGSEPDPSWAPGAAGPAETGVPEVTAHLAAWCDLLCQCAGLPPEHGDGAPGTPGSDPDGDEAGFTGRVVALPQRRGPQPL